MKNWIKNKINGFDSFSKMESFALNHFIYSTSFNKLFKGKINAKRRKIARILLGLNWLFVFLIFSKMIPVIKDIVPPYKVDLFAVYNQDINSYIVMTAAYLTTIYCMKTDFLINESSSYILFDINLLKNGFTNRLNEKNLQKMKILSELLYRLLNVAMSLGKISFTLFIIFYFLMILSNVHNTNILDVINYSFYYFFLLYGGNNAISLGGCYSMFIILSVNYVKLRFDQVNEKMLLINQNQKNFYYKRLFKLISEHKSIEKKVKLYNSKITRLFTCCLTGLTIGFISNLYVLIFSNDLIHKIFSFYIAFITLIFEVFCMLKIVVVTDSAHKPYSILNSMIVKKKINLKTKLRVLILSIQ